MAPKSSLRRLCLFRPQNQSMSQRCGFFNVPSWVMEFKPGAGWVGEVKEYSPGHCSGCKWVQSGPRALLGSVIPGEPGVLNSGHQMCSQVSLQLAMLGPNSHVERVLICLTSATCGRVSLWSKTKLRVKEIKPLWHLLKAYGLWGCKSKSTFTGRKFALHREL